MEPVGDDDGLGKVLADNATVDHRQVHADVRTCCLPSKERRDDSRAASERPRVTS
jgi:hypothetical protein